MAQINTTNPFGCQNEFILYNGTSQLYDGLYNKCNKPPVLVVINQTNVTVVNTTVIVVANYSINLTTVQCDQVQLLQTFTNQTDVLVGSLEERFNLTGLYADCRYSRDTLKSEISQCTDKVDDFTQNYITRVAAQQPVDVCAANLNVTATKLQDTEKNLNYYGIGGVIAGVLLVWFFRLRGRSDYKDSAMPIQGDYTIDSKAIEKDARRSQESYRNKVSEGVESFRKKKRR